MFLSGSMSRSRLDEHFQHPLFAVDEGVERLGCCEDPTEAKLLEAEAETPEVPEPETAQAPPLSIENRL